jgi:hypothetical protein
MKDVQKQASSLGSHGIANVVGRELDRLYNTFDTAKTHVVPETKSARVQASP